jgi:hypothetical protein
MEIMKIIAFASLVILIILLVWLRPILGLTFCIVIIVVILFNRYQNNKKKGNE